MSWVNLVSRATQAAGYELDRIDPADLKVKDGEIVILAQAHTIMDKQFILVPEDGAQHFDLFS